MSFEDDNSAQSMDSVLRQNALLKQRVKTLQAQLQTSHSNLQQSQRKLEEINSTRSYITDQLGQLTHDYEERAKQLESRMERLTKLNEKLLKENAAYREEQQLWEARFMEKERLLIGLLGQPQPTTFVSAPISKPVPSSVTLEKKSEKSYKHEKSLQRSIDQQIELEADVAASQRHRIEQLAAQSKPSAAKAFSCEDFNNAASLQGETSAQQAPINVTFKDETLSEKPEKKSPIKLPNEAVTEKAQSDKKSQKSGFSKPEEPSSSHLENEELPLPNQADLGVPEQLKPPLPKPMLVQKHTPPPPAKPKHRIRTADAVASQFGSQQQTSTQVPSETPQLTPPPSAWPQESAPTKPEEQIQVPQPIARKTSQPPVPPAPPAPPAPIDQKFPKSKRRVIADAKILNFNEPLSPPPNESAAPPTTFHYHSPQVQTIQSPKLLNTELDEHFQLHHEEQFADEPQQVNAEAFFAGIAHSEISEIPHNDDITATHYFVPGQQISNDFQAQDSFATDDDHSRSMTEPMNFFDNLGKASAVTQAKPAEKKPKRTKQLKVMDPSAFN